jgi:ribosomal protein S19
MGYNSGVHDGGVFVKIRWQSLLIGVVLAEHLG